MATDFGQDLSGLGAGFGASDEIDAFSQQQAQPQVEEEPNYLLDEDGNPRVGPDGKPILVPTTGFGEAKQDLADFTSGIGETISGLQGDTQRILNTLNTATTDGTSLGNLGIDMFQQGGQGMAGLLQDPSSILNDPIVQAQLATGLRGVTGSQAGAGLQLSGGALRELQGFGQEFAGTQIQDAFGRFKDQADLGLRGVAGGMDVGRTQLQGQEQFANIGLAGLGLEGDLLSGRMTTEANIIAGQQAAKASKGAGMMSLIGTVGGAILGGPIGASIGAGLAQQVEN